MSLGYNVLLILQSHTLTPPGFHLSVQAWSSLLPSRQLAGERKGMRVLQTMSRNANCWSFPSPNPPPPQHRKHYGKPFAGKRCPCPARTRASVFRDHSEQGRRGLEARRGAQDVTGFAPNPMRTEENSLVKMCDCYFLIHLLPFVVLMICKRKWILDRISHSCFRIIRKLYWSQRKLLQRQVQYKTESLNRNTQYCTHKIVEINDLLLIPSIDSAHGEVYAHLMAREPIIDPVYRRCALYCS